MLTLDDKKSLVDEVSRQIEGSNALILINYKSIDVGGLTELREKARGDGAKLKVVKNRLLKRAMEGTKFSSLTEHCKGQLLTMFLGENVSSGARVLSDFIKDNEAMTVSAFSFDGRTFLGSELKVLTSMPTRQEAITKVAVLLKMPIVRLARALNDVPSRMARVLTAVKDKK